MITATTSRITAAIQRGANNGNALIAYLVCGHPSLEETVELALALERGGASVIELGVPFSDPIADGPTIQRAATAALERGTTFPDCLAVARAIRARSDIPLVAMGYANPLIAYGMDRACADAAAAGIDGLIVADLPPEEANGYIASAKAHGLDTIFLVAPTSTDDRIERAVAASSGFVYCVSLTGVTGARSDLATGASDLLARVREATDLPAALGFGISTPAHVAEVAPFVDAVVVGSAIIDLVERTAVDGRVDAVERFAREMTSI
jgi:tryptophan synthase alpha chain